jgi:effector-binding domain-containing protein
MTTVTEPKIDARPERPYMGIRKKVPMSNMSREVTKLFKDLNAWVEQKGVTAAGPRFLRYHVIDMSGQMDIEVGVPVAAPLPESGNVRAGVIPAGRYASLIYVGNGYTGNKTLVEWAKANGIPWDRWDDPNGDAFRSRYESFLTDPKTEHRKTKWQIEVAIKLPDSYTK